MVHVKVRCFAAVRELLGTDELQLAVPRGTTVAGLLAMLSQQAPALASLPCAYAVNRDYAAAERELAAGDEVAFIPPISGGAGARDLYRFELTTARLDARALEAEVRTDADGAVVTFAGVTRNQHDGQAVLSLAYEAYPEMAQKVMGAIFEAAVKQFAITRARVVHRLGEVPVGEASVLVVIAAPHREPAFAACRFLMDRLKNEVPIFKRERLHGGRERWIGDLPQQPAR
jgi:molybdopterin synthase catalytic subunit